jgi:hypothetical protein
MDVFSPTTLCSKEKRQAAGIDGFNWRRRPAAVMDSSRVFNQIFVEENRTPFLLLFFA